MKTTGANEAAFPRPCGAANPDDQSLEQDGVTAREYFAAMALAALSGQIAKVNLQPEEIAQAAFSIADAMLAESKKARK